VSILDRAKAKIVGNNSYDSAKATLSNRIVATKTSFARIYYWHWKKQNFGVASNIRAPLVGEFETINGWIESEIISVKISKAIGRASGTFNVVLMPSQNWKQKISPGDWIAIYLYPNFESNRSEVPTTKNLVLLGNVDRISRSISKNEDTDRTELRYRISGRNFGKVFEETDVWFDPYINRENSVDVALREAGLELIGNPSEQFKKVLDVFMGPGAQFNDKRTSPLRQWRIPSGVASLFKIDKFSIESSAPYIYDILEKDIEPNLPGYKVRGMLSLDSNGNIFEQLRSVSNDIVNEIIIDESWRGNGTVPMISLKPRPFNTIYFDSQFGSELGKLKPLLKGKHKTLQQLAKDAAIVLDPKDIFYEDLGRDDHSRLNMYELYSNHATDYNRSIWANMNLKGVIANPTFQRESIKRHGLKRYSRQMEFDKPTAQVSGYSEVDLFKAFMVQVYDMNYANHLYENGTIETVGVLNAELGKALVLNSSNSPIKKVYFIEGYEHEWTYPGTWRTIFTLTRGQFLNHPNGRIFIDVIDDKNDFGDKDAEIDSVYIAQTRVKKDG
jgi:hypothetical protein